jgi:hypothetical protein
LTNTPKALCERLNMKNILARLSVVCGACLYALGAAANPVVTFTPSTQHAAIGELVQVDVSISGLGDEVLSAFDWNFLWNGSLMGSSRTIDATSAQLALGGGDPLQSVWTIDTVAAGNWGLRASSLLDDASLAAAQANDFLLATFTFRADSDGVTSFGLGSDLDFERNFVGLDSVTLDVTIGSACVAIGVGTCATVPEPSTSLLVALALAGVAAPSARRLRRRPA